MPPRYNQVNINELAKLYDVERQNLIGRHGKSVAKAGTKYVSNLMDSLKKKSYSRCFWIIRKRAGVA